MTPAKIDYRVAAAMPEDRGPDSLEANLRRLLRDFGIWGFHPRNSVGSERGWVDWVLIGPRGVLFRELKSERGQLTPEQRKVGSMLTRAGCNWAVWRPRDLLDGTITRQLAGIAAHPVLPMEGIPA